MGEDQNRRTLLRFYAALSRHDLDEMGDCLADGYVFYPSPGEAIEGREAFLAFEQEGFEAFPDLQVEVIATVAEGDMVAARLRMKGTHRSDFMGIPASGNSFELEYANVSRFDTSGKILEDHDFVDNLAFLQQLGVIPDDPSG